MDHARAFSAALGSPLPERLLDLGSGGGVPGLVLAYDHPSLRVALLDASERRTAFLLEAVTTLRLDDRVEILRGRAEELGRESRLRGAFDAVVARSFASPGVTAECAAPFLRMGGRIVVAEPPGSDGSRWSPEGLAALGLTAIGVVHDRPRLMLLEATARCPDRFPRRNPGKRPLF